MIKNLQKNKACPAKLQRSRGFVILFAVTLSAIFLAIALGLSNIALKELKFSTSAKDTNDAFFAADTGVECGLYYDKLGNFPIPSGSNPSINCAGSNITVDEFPTSFWTFTVPGLGPDSSPQGCAVVTVDKTFTYPGDEDKVVITSKGYNNGSPACTSSSNTVERQLELRYLY